MQKALVKGKCPICERVIMTPDKKKYNKYGREFWVEWNDGRKGKFAICKDCLPNLTKEQIEEINQRQIYTWGVEILKTYQAQMTWYINTALDLKIEKWSTKRDGVSSTNTKA